MSGREAILQHLECAPQRAVRASQCF